MLRSLQSRVQVNKHVVHDSSFHLLDVNSGMWILHRLTETRPPLERLFKSLDRPEAISSSVSISSPFNTCTIIITAIPYAWL
jgi:hypothetical protein